MEKNEVLARVCALICDELDDPELELTPETKAADVDGWDSLANLSLLHSVEADFKIRFTLKEIQQTKSVGGIVDAVCRHRGISA